MNCASDLLALQLRRARSLNHFLIGTIVAGALGAAVFSSINSSSGAMLTRIEPRPGSVKPLPAAGAPSAATKPVPAEGRPAPVSTPAPAVTSPSSAAPVPSVDKQGVPAPGASGPSSSGASGATETHVNTPAKSGSVPTFGAVDSGSHGVSRAMPDKESQKVAGLRATSLEIVDAKGNRRAYVGPSEDSSIVLYLYDAKGQVRLSLRVGGDGGPAETLYSEGQTESVRIFSQGSGAHAAGYVRVQDRGGYMVMDSSGRTLNGFGRDSTNAPVWILQPAAHVDAGEDGR